MKELAGKTVFVTGAASGIGLGIATAFAQAGAKVMLCDIEEAALSAALEQLRLTNVDVDGVKADVSLKAELVAAAEATTARYGKVHILVNNAGVGAGGPYGAWTEASWNWTMGVNLMATIWGIEIFGPLIEQHGEGGHIVSTASIAGLISGGAMHTTSPSMALSRCPRACGVNSRPEGLAYRCCVPGSSALKS
ncbi:NAD(P)-dependent dehydrogenase (short-subunit alcohol dehydrogenase family) [Bradyrhizobium sp. LA8.1]